MARYIVTGGTGFVGKALVRAIRSAGHEAVIASRGKHPSYDEDKWIEYDLRDLSTVANIIQAKPDGIYHLAWSSTPGLAEIDPANDIKTNLAGTTNLLESVASNLAIPLVFVSSGGTVYGRTGNTMVSEDVALAPISIYGMTKASTETYANLYREKKGLDVRIARLSNPYGEEQSAAKLQGAASIFAKKILNDEKIEIWGDGSVVRDYIHIEDAATGLMAIMLADKQDSDRPYIYNVGCGSGTRLIDLINSIEDRLQRRAHIRYENARPFDIPYNVLNVNKIEKELGWRAKLDLNTGLDRMIRSLMDSID